MGTDAIIDSTPPVNHATPADAPDPVSGQSAEAVEGRWSTEHQATYSPEDNKLRLRSVTRLDRETYERVRAAGFIWAPKQDLFVAPMWTPERADLLLDLCGEIGDEDMSLVERAEWRATRFAEYSNSRASDAEAARLAVSAIADNIPLGQPILVGHHSERRARKDAERIENGMRRAVRMWETSEYWTRRAAGALRHAKYKELPAVRHRRIKGLEADLRRQIKRIGTSEAFVKAWRRSDLTAEQARAIANYDHINLQVEGKPYGASLWDEICAGRMTAAAASEVAIAAHEQQIANARRWVAHIQNRLTYERAMLVEGGGLPALKFEIDVGGRVLVGREWAVVLRVIRKGGEIVSVRTNARFVSLRGIEEVTDYRRPQGDEAARVKAATKRPPMCNYPGTGFKHMTGVEWTRTHKDYKGARELGEGAERVERGSGRRDLTVDEHTAARVGGRHRVRTVVSGGALVPVYISDSKRVDPPALTAVETPTVAGPTPATATPRAFLSPKPGAAPFETMREHLRRGVQVVSAPQLFPTPAELATRMVAIAQVEDGHTLLEPSAGTGAILRAIAGAGTACTTVAVELNSALVQHLRNLGMANLHVRHGDFLDCSAGDLGTYDRILMNPPFTNAQDIEHILHARAMLRQGGRLVAICADGPRQTAKLRPLVEDCGGLWEELPETTFAGTGVRAVLLTLYAQA
jgi:protein-L-isoaspartate O-methyltransferase